jgi:two-component system chemotaxis sensor kinase CheA
MDMSRYIDVFVAECRELIDSLNLSILELERAPASPVTIDEIFRVAHTLKGTSSTMGFHRMAGLTHDMEHLLDVVRSGGRAVDHEVVSVLLGCLDVLERAVDSIESGGGEGIDPDSLSRQLQALAAGGVVDVAAAPSVARSKPDDAGLPDRSTLPDGVDLLHVAVDIDPDCTATSIRAFMAFSAVESTCEPVWSRPAAEDIDDWNHPRIDVLVVREHDQLAGELRDALARIPELAGVDVLAWGTEPETEPLHVEAAARDVESARNDEAPSEATSIRRRRRGTIRVDAERLDALMHLMGEVVVHRSAVEACLRGSDVTAAGAAMQDLRRSTQSLQAEVMRVRMVPVETALMRVPRLVRDLSAKLGKQVDLVITGADTEIDRSVVDALGDPLVHLVRNGIDHGIEDPRERRAAGKAATATLRIGARHQGGSVVITVEDDGRGVDVEQVRAHAIERGIVDRDEAALLDDGGVVELLFHPGFSTTDVATEVSGRGVGMDAVRAMCREWGGDVTIDSVHGRGLAAHIRVPLTLAVMTVLVVRAGDHDVAIPIDRIQRTFRLTDHPRAELGDGRRIVRLDDDVLEELHLGTTVGYGDGSDPTFGVIVRGGDGRPIVVSVGDLVGEQEVVTRPLPKVLRDEPAFMGAAVQGDGSVVLIVDCDHLVDGGSVDDTNVPSREGVSHD